MSCHEITYTRIYCLQIGFNIAPKEDTTLNEMLVLGLDKFVEDLTEISGRAAKEFSLEKVSKSYHVMYATSSVTYTVDISWERDSNA